MDESRAGSIRERGTEKQMEEQRLQALAHTLWGKKDPDGFNEAFNQAVQEGYLTSDGVITLSGKKYLVEYEHKKEEARFRRMVGQPATVSRRSGVPRLEEAEKKSADYPLRELLHKFGLAPYAHIRANESREPHGGRTYTVLFKRDIRNTRSEVVIQLDGSIQKGSGLLAQIEARQEEIRRLLGI
ncbi:MAG: hypothetical protein KBD15_00255 [Candidatus Magasanikbacteria bacterium]|nr:hypothetical protein [Candidatus Magasanikbacteria bacterium]